MHVVVSNGLFLHNISIAYKKCPYKFSCEQPLLFHFKVTLYIITEYTWIHLYAHLHVQQTFGAKI